MPLRINKIDILPYLILTTTSCGRNALLTKVRQRDQDHNVSKLQIRHMYIKSVASFGIELVLDQRAKQVGCVPHSSIHHFSHSFLPVPCPQTTQCSLIHLEHWIIPNPCCSNNNYLRSSPSHSKAVSVHLLWYQNWDTRTNTHKEDRHKDYFLEFLTFLMITRVGPILFLQSSILCHRLP